MTEETFAHLAYAFLLFLGCGIGVLVILLPQIDRWVERIKKKRAGQA